MQWQVRTSNSVILSSIRVLIQGGREGKKEHISSEKTHNEGVLSDFELEELPLGWTLVLTFVLRLFAPGLYHLYELPRC